MARVERLEAFAVRATGSTMGYMDTGIGNAFPDATVAVYRGRLFSPHMESLMLRVTADDGSVGWGEGQVPVGSRVAKDVVDELLAPLVLGEDPLGTSIIWDKMYHALYDRGHATSFVLDAMSAVDIALWDLKGQILNQPVYELLGGAYRTIVPTVRFDGSPEDPPERLVGLAEDAKARGFGAVKFWLGRGVSSDADVADAVRSAVGPQLDITVYCDEVYTVSQAITLGRRLERVGPCGVQVPIDHDDVAGLRRLCDTLDLRVGDGQSRRGRQAVLPLLLNRAVDLLVTDAGRVGGITEARRIFDLADALHTPYGIHGGKGFGPYLAANLHVAAAARNFTWIDYSDGLHRAANLVLRRPIEWRTGGYVLPRGPGLGIEVDELSVLKLSNSPAG
jgi:galactonate dehydratase